MKELHGIWKFIEKMVSNLINVMIIEDDPMVREINSKFLKKLDVFHLSKAVSNIAEAQNFINEYKIDLILLDLYLPKENGIDFLKWLRKEEVKVDVILITADKSSGMIQEAFRYGAVDYLIKPFTFERFKESLTNYNERYHNFNSLDIIDQNILDKYISKNISDNERDVNDNDLAKGINKYTYKLILKELINFIDVYTTAEEISEKSGVARVTVRKYLEFMEKEGKVEKLVEYGKIGRPQHKYRKLK
jgi:two-component system CitB family response regulator